MLSPKLSIIVPCYGVERYLDRCMNSLLNQTLKEIEIILVDDGSLDKVPEICDSYKKLDSRIKVIHKNNEGLGYARNSGLEIATGEYVAFVDSDDFISANMYELLYHQTLLHNSDAVFCGFKREGGNGKWHNSKEVDKVTQFKGQTLTNFMLDMVASSPNEPDERRYYMSVWHAIYRKRIIDENNIKFLSERDIASEDIPFQIDFLMKSNQVTYIPQNLYYYCLNTASLTATYKREKYDRFKQLYFILREKLYNIPSGQQRADRFFIGYCRTQLHHLMLSKTPNKLSEIKRITEDPIWNYFRRNYPVSNFVRKDLRIMYWMILNEFNRCLLLNSLFVNLLRRLK